MGKDIKRLAILGSTGSIGRQTLDVVRSFPERFNVIGLGGGRNTALLAQQAEEFQPKFISTADGGGLPGVAAEPLSPAELASHPDVDLAVIAISGKAGLEPTLAAIRTRKAVALATKEALVMAGGIIMAQAGEYGVRIMPIDSEPSAVWQCLRGEEQPIARIILTASGGPFRTWSLDQIRQATPEQALRHPNWSMGQRITVDSASMMNKGLELIEAQHLFALRPDEIDVLVHPQSVVHGLVEFRDGSVVAQLGSPDMRIPIAHCLAWPQRIDSPAARLDLARVRELTFEAPDPVRFPAVALARRVMEMGGAAPTVMNAADEVAVGEFIAGRIAFPAIVALVEATLVAASARGLLTEPAGIDAAIGIDHIARDLARDLLPEIAVKAS
jgi:1-deoxy-D-xylulose-5-phosphate reductoisomerase